MEIDILKKAGLTDSQSKGYLALITHGDLTPVELAKYADETRTNGYAIAEKLVNIGLAKKVNQSQSTIRAESPNKIRTLISARQQQLKAVNNELSGLLPTMLSKFHLSNDQPGVISVEGVEALQLVYDEIIAAKQDVLIFPSPNDHDHPDVSALIYKGIARQREAGIKSLALIPHDDYENMKQHEDGLLSIKKLPHGVEFDAQIIVFGNTVVSTVFRDGVVSTIISSPETAKTLRSTFFALWNTAA